MYGIYERTTLNHSREGATQGDPLAIAMFAIATILLIQKLPSENKQMWYADNSTAGGLLSELCTWWDQLSTLGPAFDYFPSPRKTKVLVQEQCLIKKATKLFKGTDILITSKGRNTLGSPIGTESFV